MCRWIMYYSGLSRKKNSKKVDIPLREDSESILLTFPTKSKLLLVRLTYSDRGKHLQNHYLHITHQMMCFIFSNNETTSGIVPHLESPCG